MPFASLGLSDEAVHAVQRLRFLEPTPIQEQAIPAILQGRDVIASAQTGTGKTAAFVLPLVCRLGTHSHPRVLILEPTRELAAQVHEAIDDYTHFVDLTGCLLHGGVKYEPQQRTLRQGPDFIVATPGRLLDLQRSRHVDLSTIEVVVLDEADRMLDMGFLPDVTRIVELCPNRKQTLLFSATVPPAVGRLIAWAMREPMRIEINADRRPAETIDHALYPVASDQKFDLLLALLDTLHYESVLVFSRTKSGADRIAHTLKHNGHKVLAIHSDLTQAQRTSALERFRSGEIEVLVATNIAARGLDIEGISHVINYDMPEHPDDYVHRIGRTGRANKSGDALTLFTAFDISSVYALEQLLGTKIPRRKLDGFNYLYTTLLDENAGAAKRRGRSRRR